MRGWKTWTGAALIAAAAVLRYFGHGELADALLTVGAALGLVGVAHKIEKAAKGQQ
ncbi:MAG TPA: hypothetical protein VNN17_06895 [Terriglobia bacterium]|nr:hypothetical protein [Terriglobia bacterium]